MTSNLKVILSAVGVAALVASPAMAKSHVRTHHVAPVYGQVYTAPPYAERQLVTPYGASLPERGHEMPGQAPDFQLGGEKQ
jgi:hypothetical protein